MNLSEITQALRDEAAAAHETERDRREAGLNEAVAYWNGVRAGAERALSLLELLDAPEDNEDEIAASLAAEEERIADDPTEWEADAYLAQWDDDPSPYSGNYSEL